MKKISTLKIAVMAIIISILTACGDKGIDVKTLQNSAEHLTNIASSKNASEAIGNISHAINNTVPTNKVESSIK